MITNLLKRGRSLHNWSCLSFKDNKEKKIKERQKKSRKVARFKY